MWDAADSILQVPFRFAPGYITVSPTGSEGIFDPGKIAVKDNRVSAACGSGRTAGYPPTYLA